jgi:hypothetical protein
MKFSLFSSNSNNDNNIICPEISTTPSNPSNEVAIFASG